MKHSNDSIKKAMENLRKAMEYYGSLSFVDLRLHISKGNRKIGMVHNFSMAPGITCANCSGCLNYCYDIKAVLQYRNVVTARAENTVLMKQYRGATFAAIDEYISRQKVHKFFRWHVSGDILDVDYFDSMVRIARNHPDWIFWTYTKNYSAVNAWLDSAPEGMPDNLSVMFSVWNGMPCPNPHGLPTFTCIQEGMEPAPDQWKCPGNCDACLRSGHGCPFRQSSYVYEH